MYGSPYGSYSGMSAPLDIAPSQAYSRPQDAGCAFPSWPRRDSLSSGSDNRDSDSHYERATSYLSDEDLFPSSDPESDYHSDCGAHSIASSSSNGSTPTHHHHQADMLELRQRQQVAYQREVMRFLALEKERRRSQQQAAMRKSSSGSGSKSRQPSSKKGSPKSKLAAMTPIAEAE